MKFKVMGGSEKTNTIIQPGTNIGPFSIISPLGEGAMGSVYKAYDSALNRHVALKVIHSSHYDNVALIMRFTSEGQALARLNHQNVVGVYTMGEENGRHYIAMEYVEGDELEVFVRRRSIPIVEILDIFIQMLKGVQAIHERGIIHRDLKPKNIIVCKDKVVKIVDFGVAKFGQQQNIEMTNSGRLVGSVPYLSPELVSGEPARFQSDIWSLGIILFELLFGTRPFVAENQLSLIEKIKTQDLVFPEWNSEIVPKTMLKIVTKMCDKKIYRRYLSIDDIFADLNEMINTEAALSSHRVAPKTPQTVFLKQERVAKSGAAFSFSSRLFVMLSFGLVFIGAGLIIFRRALIQEQNGTTAISRGSDIAKPQTGHIASEVVIKSSTSLPSRAATPIGPAPQSQLPVAVAASPSPPPAPPPVVAAIEEKPDPEVAVEKNEDEIDNDQESKNDVQEEEEEEEVVVAKPKKKSSQAKTAAEMNVIRNAKVIKKSGPEKPKKTFVKLKRTRAPARPEIKNVKLDPVEPAARSPAAISTAIPDIEKPAAILPTPKTKLPPLGISIVSLNKTQDPVIFRWEKIEAAKAYSLEISTLEDFSMVLISANVRVNQMIVTKPLPPGRIYWRVRAMSNEGHSDWTTPSFFELTK